MEVVSEVYPSGELDQEQAHAEAGAKSPAPPLTTHIPGTNPQEAREHLMGQHSQSLLTMPCHRCHCRAGLVSEAFSLMPGSCNPSITEEFEGPCPLASRQEAVGTAPV